MTKSSTNAIIVLSAITLGNNMYCVPEAKWAYVEFRQGLLKVFHDDVITVTPLDDGGHTKAISILRRIYDNNHHHFTADRSSIDSYETFSSG